VREHALIADRERRYENALQHLISTYERTVHSHEPRLYLAKWYARLAASYEPFGDTSHRMKAQLAVNLLRPIVSGAAGDRLTIRDAEELLAFLQRRTLSFELEKVNVPGLPMRMVLRYRNVRRIWLRIVAAPESYSFSAYADSSWTAAFKSPAVQYRSIDLPGTEDLQEHLVELKAEALPAGRYLLLIADAGRFLPDSTVAAAAFFQNSSISLVGNNPHYFVLNRQQGKPLSGAEIQSYHYRYEGGENEMQRRNGKSYRADATGMFRLADAADERENRSFEIRYGGERLLVEDAAPYYYEYRQRGETTQRAQVSWFTDRSMYRPGQTLFFKGITYHRKQRPSVATDQPLTVLLYDANAQARDTLKLHTNAFGSVSGSFRLPAGGLTGSYSIRALEADGSAYFSVEEYKRPKFEVRFDTRSTSYRVGDTIRVSGRARAYAGNSVNGAKVRYTVARVPRFIGWWWGARGTGGERQELTQGETRSAADGSFALRFPALPDPSIDPKQQPLFDYEVTAVITDIAGETREATQTVTAGYQSRLIRTALPARMPVDSLRNLNVQVENMNGRLIPAQLTTTFTRLIPENRLIRERYWQRPDQHLYTKTQYLEWFPNDVYAGEDDFRNWPRATTDIRQVDSAKGAPLPLRQRPQEPGFYELRFMTPGERGDSILLITFLELYQPGQPNRPEYLALEAPETAAQPGDRIRLRTRSTLPEAWVIAQTERMERQDSIPDALRLLHLTGPHESGLVVEEADRGGLAAGRFTVIHNRLHGAARYVAVPWTNKELRLSFGTLRDKTLPGSREEWRINIHGGQGEAVAAELLAGLYDAALDQFSPHAWMVPGLYPSLSAAIDWESRHNFGAQAAMVHEISVDDPAEEPGHDFDRLLGSIDEIAKKDQAEPPLQGYYQKKYRGPRATRTASPAAFAAPAASEEKNKMEERMLEGRAAGLMIRGQATMAADSSKEVSSPQPTAANPVQVRRNLNETAFFSPALRTDSSGSISFAFTLPEALTRWKFQALAHTQQLAFGYATRELITQKELMVQPNMPRFLRQGDKLELTVKIANLSAGELTGQVQLELFDAATGVSVDGWFQSFFPNQYFTVAAGGSEVVSFPVEIPYLFNSALTWRFTARAGNFSDAEEATLPVLSNKTLVTETLPLPMTGAGAKTFTFEKLLQSGNSETLQHHAFTLEYTANPAWQAVLALPYLMEYPYECAEQVWNRYYAHTLSAHILQRTPRIREVLRRWENKDTAALLSNLEKNQELKTALLEETPWVLDAQNETRQRKNIARLFELSRLAEQQSGTLEKLRALQLPDGSFPWFAGGRSDRYITQYILTGMARLQHLGIKTPGTEGIRQRALAWTERLLQIQYEQTLKRTKPRPEAGPYEVQYLYLRSLLGGRPEKAGVLAAFEYYLQSAGRTWTKMTKRTQGMTALALHRFGQKAPAREILRSLSETAQRTEETGIYWADNRFGKSWYWWSHPVETQAQLLEAYREIGDDRSMVDGIRTWMLKHKQSNSWPTTTATADACYVLLLEGTDWIAQTPAVEIQAGSLRLLGDTAAEAGTGYFKKSVPGKEVRPAMGRLTVKVTAAAGTNSVPVPSWGAAYWQYFEDMDKVTTAATPLKLERQLFVSVPTPRGPELRAVSAGQNLHVGDKVVVRIVVRADRDMEYVHLKDLRGSNLEPQNVLSGYRWQGLLGYYESTRDASTNFFINYLPKGTHVFEYALFVTHRGTFNAGLSTIQCLYAPEFSAHSEGQQITTD